MTDRGHFIQAELDTVCEVIFKLLSLRKKLVPNENPHAYLLAGQPGAGKTVLSSYFAKLYHGNIVLINGDEYRRYHPRYGELYSKYGTEAVKLLSPFSSAMVERCIGRLSDRGYNLIIEGTGRTYEVPKKTSELLNAKGYSVEMAVIAVRPECSLLSTIKRFFEMSEKNTTPRGTPVEAHDIVVDNLPGNLDKLLELPSISRIRILDRDASKIYDSESESTLPGEALYRYWNRPWTDIELSTMQSAIEALEAKESERNLGTWSVIEELRQRYRRICSDTGLDNPPQKTNEIPR